MFKRKCEYEVNLIENKKETKVEVKAANEESILTALALFVKQLKENGNIEEHKIKYAVNLGLGKDEIPNIKVKEIHITDKNKDEFKEILEKLMRED